MNSFNASVNEKTELNEIKSNDIFLILKSKYILQLIFDNLSKRKSLNFIKYNKNIQNKIDININDYKEFSEIYSSIEMEIIPVNNKYGKFINIKNQGDLKYFHIYFDNNKEEIKRNHLDKNENIKKIKVILEHQVESFEDLFRDCECVESIYFKKFCRNNIKNMEGMFYNCSSLKELNLSNFNTDNVTNMRYMFFKCSSLKKLNLSNFNTNNVTALKEMFWGCSSLEELNLNSFNTNKVKSFYRMFEGCSSLKELNLSNFNINKVTNMYGMFSNCWSLKDLILFDDNCNIIDMEGMFNGCLDKLTSKIKDKYKYIKEEAFKFINDMPL